MGGGATGDTTPVGAAFEGLTGADAAVAGAGGGASVAVVCDG